MKPLQLLIAVFTLSLTVAATARAEITGADYDYTINGTAYQGYVAHNANLEQSRGTVLIIHDWDGLTDYEKRRAEMLASLGYTAFAIDVYGRDNRPTSMQENQQRSGEMYANRDAVPAPPERRSGRG